jgi:carbamoyltransferase
MRVLGLNLGATRSGKPLKDGGVCIIEDGMLVVCIAEERVCRKKYAGGFANALEYCLDYTGLDLHSFDVIVVSSCCEDITRDYREGLRSFDISRIHYIPSHHLSHAYSAYFPSPFEEALVIVMDAGGNILGKQTYPQWWKNRREQVSYYRARGNQIELIGRDFDHPLDAGFGEIFRSFTYYLGWNSSVHAGKTMALAAYGDPERYDDVELFFFDGTHLRSVFTNNPPDPVGMIEQFALKEGLDFPHPRRGEDAAILQGHKDVAFLVQDRFERALIHKVNILCKLTGITNLCIAGGVGLNCVANAKILERTPIKHIFIQPAAGDQGQCLGNALYGYYHILGGRRRSSKFTPYLGRSYSLSSSSIRLQAETIFGDSVEVIEIPNWLEEVAELIAEGNIVGWYQGRSEFGPRALGNRSILADPRRPGLTEKLRQLKDRESFMLFAPSVLAEHADEYFELSVPSPYMLLAVKTKSDKIDAIPAVVHVNDSARIQTVAREENELYYDLIKTFAKLTNTPVLLNTSLNRAGEPIVETPMDALDCFREMDMEYLVIDEYILRKVKEQRQWRQSVVQQATYDLSTVSPEQLSHYLLRDFPGFTLEQRNKISLHSTYLHWCVEGKKTATVKYRGAGRIDYPSSYELELFETEDNNVTDNGRQVGKVRLTKMTIKPFRLLTDLDAHRDGFPHRQQLQAALQQIYGSIGLDDYIIIYDIELIEA